MVPGSKLYNEKRFLGVFKKHFWDENISNGGMPNLKVFIRVYRVLKAKISNRFRLFTSILRVQQKPRDQSHSYFISVFHWKSKNNLSTNAEILNWKVPRFIAMVDCKRCCVRQQRELMANAKWNGKNEFCTWEQMRGMYTWCVGYIYYTELF